MGSLTSRPAAAKTVFVPSPQPAAIQTPVTTTQTQEAPTANQSNETPEQTKEDTQTAARENNLLNRSRGRASTIVSGFRGVLSNPAASSSGQKTLLGE